MITVIIAGGSGTRLWPLSTPSRPKHTLALIGERTLLQAAYDRATTLGDTIYVVTMKDHSDLVREQLSQLPDEAFLIEPDRRGTAHCIVFALDVIARRHSHDEPIAFIHADHHVRDTAGFTRSFGVAGRISQDRHEITLIGIEPTYPSVGMGYIERDGVIDADRGVYAVKKFKEKPDYETAREYVGSGTYLWNCGYFVGSVQTFLDEIKRSSPSMQSALTVLGAINNVESDEYREAYLRFGSEVIDIALIERAKQLAVVSANFDWTDVGSFKDLHDAVNGDEQGNFFQGDKIHAIDAENAYIRNDSDTPVVVIGLDNIVIVNTPNGILVSRKDVSQRVGEVGKEL